MRHKNSKPNKTHNFTPQRLLEMAEAPSTWNTVSDETLGDIVFAKLINYGQQPNAMDVPLPVDLYRHYMSRTPEKARLDLCLSIGNVIHEERGAACLGLLPCAQVEDSPTIIQSAAMELAQQLPLTDGNPLTGPEFVVNLVAARPHPTEIDGHILAGVLLLGDRRVLPLIEHAWSRINDPARMHLIRAHSGFIYDAVVDFLLTRLEGMDSDAEMFGIIAANIAQMPDYAAVNIVHDIRRNFPLHANPKSPTTQIRNWTFKQYLNYILPRLKNLADREAEPKIIFPTVIRAWK